MASYKWIGKGVFSFENKFYRKGETIPDGISSKTLKSLKIRKLVEKAAKVDQKEVAKAAAELLAKEAAELAAKEAAEVAKKKAEDNKNETK